MTTRAEIIGEGRRWIGTPYLHQASVWNEGCDCLGLLRGIWRACYGPEPEETPPYSRDFAERSGRETLHEACARWLTEIAVADAQPADVLLYRLRINSPAKHCAILTEGDAENGMIVHAYASHGVCETPTTWAAAYAFRFPGV